jgi:uncharacterized protein
MSIRIGLISDTHGHLDDAILEALQPCDEIWHAGDVGSVEVIDTIQALHPIRGVYGNIDDHIVRRIFPEELIFTVEGLKVYMVHIGGYPTRYVKEVKKRLVSEKPDLYICGHSHICKVVPDYTLNLLHMNPGACGQHGFHKVRTLLRFSIMEGQIKNLEVVELGLRGRL